MRGGGTDHESVECAAASGGSRSTLSGSSVAASHDERLDEAAIAAARLVGDEQPDEPVPGFNPQEREATLWWVKDFASDLATTTPSWFVTVHTTRRSATIALSSIHTNPKE